jgi:hypothetical protein
VTLLELTDVALLQTSRRSQQLFREAADKAQSNRVRGTTGLIQQAAKARSVLHDESKTWQARVLEARDLLAELGEAASGSFVSLVRKALAEDSQRVHACLAALTDLDFGGRSGDPGFEQWKSWSDLQRQGVTELKEGVPLPDVGAAWHGLVRDLDPRSGFRAYEACTMMSLRKSLRRGSVWLDHSLSFRERDQMLIPPADWALQRDEQVELLGMPKSAADFLEPLLANLMAGMSAVAEAQRRGKVEIGADGMLHLPAITALPDQAEPVRTRETIYNLIGSVQFPDMLLEVDAATGYSEALLGHRAQSTDELVALYGALLAHGTDADAKGVASMIPGLEPTQVTWPCAPWKAAAAAPRQRARGRVPEPDPIASLWGDGDKASADMMSLDVSRHLWNARVDPRRAHMPLACTPTCATAGASSTTSPSCSTNDRPASPSRASSSTTAPQTGFGSRCWRSTPTATRIRRWPSPSCWALICARGCGSGRTKALPASWIHRPGWLGSGHRPARVFGRHRTRLGRVAAPGGVDPLGTCLRHAGVAALRVGRSGGSTAPGCGTPGPTAANRVPVRLHRHRGLPARDPHLLNRGESVHQLQRAVYSGKVAPERGRRRDEMKAISGSHALLTNIVLAWNTARMHEVVERLKRDGIRSKTTGCAASARRTSRTSTSAAR